MDKSITMIKNKIPVYDLKEILLERNEKWMQKKDGSSDINGSLKTVVISCIDSRVPVENIFQAKPGEILVLKNAGNIITDDILRSLLVAIYELKAENIIILGHTRCGMAIKNNQDKIKHLSDIIGTSTLEMIEKTYEKDPIDWFGFFDQGSWNENVFHQENKIRENLSRFVPFEVFPNIIPAIYDIDSGKVVFI